MMPARKNRGERGLNQTEEARFAKSTSGRARNAGAMHCDAASPGVIPVRLLRIKEVAFMTGLSRMTIYRLERAGEFPQLRRLGIHSVAWLEHDVSHWVSTLPVALSPDNGGNIALVHRARRSRA